MADSHRIRQPHDLGGLDAGPVDQSQHELAIWEKRADALVCLLEKRDLINLDQFRRAREGLGPGLYERLGYYEKWVAATAQLLLESAVISVDELGAKMQEIMARSE